MSNALSFELGHDGFVYFVGVVEDMNDPLAVGRCKIRIFGIHDKNTDNLSTDDLPWAIPLLPVTQSATLPNYRIGDWVCGFFLDAKLAQTPVILGVFPSVVQK